jgi:hypothetical protein
MMITVAYLRRALRILVCLMWLPMPVWAATVAVGAHPFDSVDLPVLALAFGLSTLSGATALVWRLDRELRTSPDGHLPRPWLFAASNILGSWTAGAFAWITSQSQDGGVWLTLGVVIVASFAGARLIEVVAERYINKGVQP